MYRNVDTLKQILRDIVDSSKNTEQQYKVHDVAEAYCLRSVSTTSKRTVWWVKAEERMVCSHEHD